MDLTKEFKVLGKWWLPENDKHFCFGELSYKFSKGIQLCIYGSLTGTENILFSKSNFFLDFIWGQTNDGKCITLITAFGHEIGSNHLLQSKFTIEYASVSNTHFLTLETDFFDLISINLNCSESFFFGLYSPLKIKEFDEEGILKELQYKKSEPKQLYNKNGTQVSLFFSYTLNMSHSGPNEFEFSQRVFINSELQNPLLFKNAIEYGQNIKKLFSFLSSSKVFFKNLTIRKKQSGEYFDILFIQNNKTVIQKLDKNDLLLTYKEMKGEFEQVIKWWIENNEFVTNGLSFYLQLIDSSQMSAPQRLLSIVFALETLHTTFFDKKFFSDSDYKNFKKQKKAFEMDTTFKERFNECMGHFNDLTFRKRIIDLFEMNKGLLEEFIDDINVFSAKVTNQRNYFAHKHSQEYGNVIPPKDFEYYTYMCKLIFDVTFLQMIGISKMNIQLILERDFLLNYYKNKKPIND